MGFAMLTICRGQRKKGVNNLKRKTGKEK